MLMALDIRPRGWSGASPPRRRLARHRVPVRVPGVATGSSASGAALHGASHCRSGVAHRSAQPRRLLPRAPCEATTSVVAGVPWNAARHAPFNLAAGPSTPPGPAARATLLRRRAGRREDETPGGMGTETGSLCDSRCRERESASDARWRCESGSPQYREGAPRALGAATHTSPRRPPGPRTPLAGRRRGWSLQSAGQLATELIPWNRRIRSSFVLRPSSIQLCSLGFRDTEVLLVRSELLPQVEEQVQLLGAAQLAEFTPEEGRDHGGLPVRSRPTQHRIPLPSLAAKPQAFPSMPAPGSHASNSPRGRSRWRRP